MSSVHCVRIFIILCAPFIFFLLWLHLVRLSLSIPSNFFLSFLYSQLFSLLHPPIFLHEILLLCFIFLHFSSLLAFFLLTHLLLYNFCPPVSPLLPPIFYFLFSICAIHGPIMSFSSKHILYLPSVIYRLEFLFTAFSEVVSLNFSVCLVSHPSKLNVLDLTTVTICDD